MDCTKHCEYDSLKEFSTMDCAKDCEFSHYPDSL